MLINSYRLAPWKALGYCASLSAFAPSATYVALSYRPPGVPPRAACPVADAADLLTVDGRARSRQHRHRPDTRPPNRLLSSKAVITATVGASAS